MRTFLDRFYSEVYEWLGDPAATVRITKTSLYENLTNAATRIWERLLMATGQESSLGYTESTITVANDTRYYNLPGNFRQFIKFELRDSSDENVVLKRLGTIQEGRDGGGVIIMSGQRGFRIQPTPSLSSSESWTLCYMGGPVLLHTATAASGSSTSIEFASPSSSDYGELVEEDDYYNGSLVRIVSGTGAHQVREITDYDGASVTATTREWTTAPDATSVYEIVPLLPYPYDNIMMLEVARIYMMKRRNRRYFDLKAEWDRSWHEALSYVMSNTADRAPERWQPNMDTYPDPYTDGVT